MNIFNILFVYPITNILVVLYQLLNFLHIPFALGFAIILLTVIIKVILWPLASAQIKSATKMQKVAPHLAAVKEKHKNDKKKQQEEMMKVYKDHGINPAAGCLPVLLQIPILWSLYSVLTTAVDANSISAINEHINKILYFPSLKVSRLWDTSFFGLPLALKPSDVVTSMPLILLIPLLTGAFQFVYSKMMMPADAPKKTAKDKDDFQSALQAQSLFIFPIMIAYFSYTLPLGLSLYWNTFTLFGILQQYQLAGPGGLAPWIEKLKANYGKK